MDDGHRPAVCAPTGKAAHVLNSKQSFFRANTIHKVLTKRPFNELEKIHKRLDEIERVMQAGSSDPALLDEQKALYKRLDTMNANDDEGLSFSPRDPMDFLEEYTMLVIDEASMVGRDKIYEPMIAGIPCPKFFFGDRAQLPPVNDVPAIDLDNADVRFEEILRQKGDSGIIPFSHYVTKNGEYMDKREARKFADLTIIENNDVKSVADYIEDHQILVWKNATRHQIAPFVRQVRGADLSDNGLPIYVPRPGEILMVDANNEAARLLKGQLITVTSIEAFMDGETHQNPYIVLVKAIDDKNNERTLKISLSDLIGNYPMKHRKTDKRLDDRDKWRADKTSTKVQWNGVCTVHKAQGSEWDKVFYLGEMKPSMKDWKRLVYTAVTRAAKQLVVADGDFRFQK